MKIDKTRKLIISIFVWVLSGCAINDTGLLKLRFFANDSVRMISRESWGAYLSTDSTNAGLTLGHAKVIQFYPNNHNAVKLELDELLKKVQEDQLIEIAEKEWHIPDMEPIAWVSNKQGLMLNTNQFRFGMSLGMERRNIIRLPREFNGIFIFHATTDGKFKAYFHENSP